MKKSNKLTVYLSYSLADSDGKFFNKTKSILQDLGFNVTHYIKGESYKSDKIEEADLVLFITLSGYDHVEKTETITRYQHFVGKGQFSEAEICYRMTKPAYMVHCITPDDDDIFVTTVKNTPPILFNSIEWKKEFGTMQSFGRAEWRNSLKEILIKEGFLKKDDNLEKVGDIPICFL